MTVFANIKIGTRILAILVLFACGLVGVTLIGLNALRTYDSASDHMQNEATRGMLALKASGIMAEMVAETRGIYSAATPEETRQMAGRLNRAVDRFEALIPVYEAAQPPERRQMFAERKRRMLDFAQYRREVARLSITEGIEKAREFGRQPKYTDLRDALEKEFIEATERNDAEIKVIAANR